ncbi:MAG: hypothetical protein QNJ97_12960 [Myxococcota bacterium]|nr:hypothetical protein [Myxococcota bacterium]
MAVAALVLGILGVVIFSWLGPLLGVVWATSETAQTFGLTGQTSGAPEIVTWPLWLMGLLFGVGIPLAAIILGGVAMKKTPSKGVALGGVVTGAIGAIAAIGWILFFQATASLGQSMLGDVDDPVQFQQQMQQMQQMLDDPALQQQIQQQLQRAQDLQAPEPVKPQPMQPVPEQPQAPPQPTPPPTSPPPGPQPPAQEPPDSQQ